MRRVGLSAAIIPQPIGDVRMTKRRSSGRSVSQAIRYLNVNEVKSIRMKAVGFTRAPRAIADLG
jgi:hypothetical protein